MRKLQQLLAIFMISAVAFCQQNAPPSNMGLPHTYPQAQFQGFTVGSQQMLFIWSDTQAQGSSSAGIFDSNGNLIRTVWSNKAWPSSGSYLWDGMNDAGTPVAVGGNYTLRARPNDLKTAFALIGTTESDWYSDTNWDAMGWFPTSGMAIGDNIYVSNNYCEQRMPISIYNRLSPNANIRQFPNLIWNNNCMSVLDTDGQSMIYGQLSAGGGSAYVTGIVAIGVNGQPYSFPQGGGASSLATWLQQNNFPLPGFSGPQYSPNICDYEIGTSTSISLPTGFSVTHAASGYIAVSHGYSDLASRTTPSPSLDVIRLFDMHTCAALRTISIPNPQVQAQDTAGNIWVISGYFSGATGANTTPNVLYEITSPTSSPVVTANPVPGIINPMAIHYDPVTQHIYINDGGTSQQVKEIDPVAKTVLSTIGKLGGFGSGVTLNGTVDPGTNGSKDHNNPTFLFDPSLVNSHISGGGAPFSTSVWTDAIGDVWVGDLWNFRVMHYHRPSTTGAWSYVNRIMMFPYSYDVSADYTSGRVFGGMQPSLMEYSVNNNMTVQPGDPDPNLGGNGAWEESINWLPVVLGSGLPGGMGTTMRQTITCGNNLIAFFFANVPNSGIYPSILNTDGTMKIKATTPDSIATVYRGVDLQCKGLYGITVTGTAPNYTNSYLLYLMTGIDTNGFPIFSTSYTTLATVSGNVANGDPIITINSYGLNYFAPTAGNMIPVWQGVTNTTATNGPIYSEGLVTVNGSTFQMKFFQQKVISYPDGEGTFPFLSSTMAAGQGGYTYGIGHDIYNFYNGNWDAVGCRIYHWYDDGLLLNDIGWMGSFDYRNMGSWTNPGYPQQTGQIPTPGVPYMCGDVNSMYSVPITDGYAHYHGDEGMHRGLSQVKETGFSTIHTYQGTGQLGQTIPLTQIN